MVHTPLIIPGRQRQAGRSFRSVWSTDQVAGQLGLHTEMLSQKHQINNSQTNSWALHLSVL